VRVRDGEMGRRRGSKDRGISCERRETWGEMEEKARRRYGFGLGGDVEGGLDGK
jgi:hypothetical protein